MTDASGVFNAYDAGFLGLALGIVPGLLLLFVGLKLSWKKRMIQNTPTSTIRSIPIGLAEIQGKVRPFEQVYESPFTGKPCVLLEYEITENYGKMPQLIQEFFSEPVKFYLQDGTGKVLIDPVDAEWHIAGRLKNYSLSDKESDRREFLRALETLGIRTKMKSGNDRFLYGTVKSIEIDDDLYVMATATEDPQVDGPEKGVENIRLCRKEDSFFYISDQSEKNLLTKLNQQAFFSLWGGLLWVSVCSGLIWWSLNGIEISRKMCNDGFGLFC